MAKNKIIITILFWFIFTSHISAINTYYDKVKAVSESQLYVRESGKNNHGVDVAKYLAETNLPQGNSWCAAFIVWVFNQVGIPHRITAWSPTTYNKKDVIYTNNEFKQLYSDKDVMTTSLSYDKFKNVKSRYKGIGHCGIVKQINKNSVDAWEGNTNDAGARDSRAGKDGVYLKRRSLSKNIHITRWVKEQ